MLDLTFSLLYRLSIRPAIEAVESQVDYLIFVSGLIAGGGLTAAVIFGTDAWYARRHPILRRGA